MLSMINPIPQRNNQQHRSYAKIIQQIDYPLYSQRGFTKTHVKDTQIINFTQQNKQNIQSNHKISKIWKILGIIVIFLSIKVVFSLVKYVSDYNYIQIPEVTITVIFYGFAQNNYVQHSLYTFYKMNSYKINNIIGVVKQIPNQQLLYQFNTIKQFNQVIWIINDQVDQEKWYNKIDNLLKNLQKTDYYFIFDDQWMFIKQGFIQKSLSILQKYKNVTQVLLYNKQIKRIGIHQKNQKGFSFTPGLHRRSDLLELEGGFTNFIDNSKDKLQQKISKYFISKQKYALHTENIYVQPMYSSNRFRVIQDFLQYEQYNQQKSQN